MSNVTVSIKMTAKQSGALYTKNIALEKKIATLEAEILAMREAKEEDDLNAKEEGIRNEDDERPDLYWDNFL
jgi:hypothetical protein